MDFIARLVQQETPRSKMWGHIHWESCPECGDDARGLTACPTSGQFYEGDKVRCMNEECEAVGSVCIDQDTGDTSVVWHIKKEVS